MRKNLAAIAAGAALAFALAGAVSPAAAWGSTYPAGTAPAATNGDIRVNTAAASSDPDDGGQLPAATTGDVRIGNGG